MEKRKKTFLSLGSALGSAAVMYALLPPVVAGTIGLVLIIHEAGHYIVGTLAGADADLPIFIPIGYFLIGITRIRGLADEFKSSVAIIGPLAGVGAALGLLIVGIFTGIEGLALAAMVTLAFEVWSGTLGSDGQRYRRARKEFTQWRSSSSQ